MNATFGSIATIRFQGVSSCRRGILLLFQCPIGIKRGGKTVVRLWKCLLCSHGVVEVAGVVLIDSGLEGGAHREARKAIKAGEEVR